ncbi:MAG: methionine gamma-lyase [Spirochaetes bacterium]|nr:methionine gamma-lyase [Spirochaetota bacterium]
MKDYKNAGFATRAIHAGNIRKQHGPLAMPIYQSSTFVFETTQQGGNRFAGEEGGYIYTRLGNPTTSVLEAKLAALEGSQACVAFSSGMGAITSVLWTVCKKGSHIIADITLYGCTFVYLSSGMTKYGVEVSFVDTCDINAVKNALKENTEVVLFESPANPNLKVIDIKALADAAHSHNPNIKVICDNTFATPMLQKPLDLGCDIVVHSATKYLNGHGDVIAGFACGNEDVMTELRMVGLKDMTGAVLGPFDAFLILRGLKTLEIRMQRHCENAMKLAEYLKAHPKVERVHFPGLKSDRFHEVAAKQMNACGYPAFGGMVAFEVKGGRQAGAKLLDNMQMCVIAVSLGDAETLVQHPATMTHSVYDAASLAEAGIAEGLVRVSAGLENIQDIIADFDQSFTKI